MLGAGDTEAGTDVLTVPVKWTRRMFGVAGRHSGGESWGRVRNVLLPKATLQPKPKIGRTQPGEEAGEELPRKGNSSSKDRVRLEGQVRDLKRGRRSAEGRAEGWARRSRDQVSEAVTATLEIPGLTQQAQGLLSRQEVVSKARTQPDVCVLTVQRGGPRSWLHL